MSDTQDQSHFTVEDAGTTTDAGDLANSGVGHAVRRDEDPVESADEVARATDAVPAAREQQDTAVAPPVDGADVAEESGAPVGTEETVQQAQSTQQAEPAEQTQQAEPADQPDDAGETAAAVPVAASAPHVAHGDLSALADADLGHVFDQTNGMIERADGDSDGSAESDVFSESERFEDDPTVIDAGVHGDGEVSESRHTGD